VQGSDDSKTPTRSTRSRLVAHTGFCSARGRREANEDFAGSVCKATDAQALVIAAVADGVGGAKGGRVAAELAVRTFIQGCLGAMPRVPAKTAALASLTAANRWLHATSRRDDALTGMACTFTALVCLGRQAHVVHVGDSRLYRLRGERLELLTTDHNAGPGLAHVLTRAVAAEEDVRMDYVSLQNDAFDRYLLCTDGIHGGLSDDVLRELLGRRRDADETAREIVARALDTAVGDNATALIVDIVDVPAATYAEIAAGLAASDIGALPEPGGEVDGFRLDAVLGDSRYVRVFRAYDTIEGRDVVLKFPKPLAGAERPSREAFLRESFLASRVESPFVGEVIWLAPERQTQLYLALPFYAGETLESRLRRAPALSLTAGLDLAIKLTRAVAAVHRAGVIHRDIKPENVILLEPAPGQGTKLKLVDFGVARLQRAGVAGEAEPGTPSFMAPELFTGANADERSDQYALGVAVYRLFTRHYPFGEIEPFSHPKFRAPAPLVAHRPDLPAWLDRTIARAIAVDPAGRYADVLEFMFELEHGADRASPISVERKSLYDRDPLLFWKVVSAVLAVLLMLAGFMLVQSRQHAPPARHGAGAAHVVAAGEGSGWSPFSQDEGVQYAQSRRSPPPARAARSGAAGGVSVAPNGGVSSIVLC
jgi:serine/threonine protein phosphatase PrpC